jgi:hypothetical protein
MRTPRKDRITNRTITTTITANPVGSLFSFNQNRAGVQTSARNADTRIGSIREEAAFMPAIITTRPAAVMIPRLTLALLPGIIAGPEFIAFALLLKTASHESGLQARPDGQIQSDFAV